MFWDDKYLPLSTYNGEVSRGILHTEEYKEKMKLMQEQYINELREWGSAKGYIVL